MLDQLVLFVKHPAELAKFYVNVLKMTVLRIDERDGSCVVGYAGDNRRDMSVCFKRCSADSVDVELIDEGGPGGSGGGEARTPAAPKTHRYWKIGVGVPNVDAAVSHVRAAGATCSDGGQFKDVGYVAHLKDPEGFSIELLQFTFGKVAPVTAAEIGARRADAAHGLEADDGKGGGGAFDAARIGQVTLRAKEKDTMLDCWVKRLGLQLISVQPVEQFNFELYFFVGSFVGGFHVTSRCTTAVLFGVPVLRCRCFLTHYRMFDAAQIPMNRRLLTACPHHTIWRASRIDHGCGVVRTQRLRCSC